MLQKLFRKSGLFFKDRTYADSPSVKRDLLYGIEIIIMQLLELLFEVCSGVVNWAYFENRNRSKSYFALFLTPYDSEIVSFANMFVCWFIFNS